MKEGEIQKQIFTDLLPLYLTATTITSVFSAPTITDEAEEGSEGVELGRTELCGGRTWEGRTW